MASDQEILTMLTTRNDAQVNNQLTVSFMDIIEVVAPLMGKKGGTSEFRVPTYNKKGEYKTLKTQNYPQYGNPLGVYHPGYSDPEEGVYLTEIVAKLLNDYEEELEHLREVAQQNHVPAEEYLASFRIDTPIVNVDGKPTAGNSLSLNEPIGAVRNIKIDMRGRYRNLPAARVEFTFQPQGKQPVMCQGQIPYQVGASGKRFITINAGLWCKLGEEYTQIVTLPEEDMLLTYEENRAKASMKRMSGGMCGAECSAPSSTETAPLSSGPVGPVSLIPSPIGPSSITP